MGLGIYKKYNGVIYITQEFSCPDLSQKPMTPAFISEIKNILLSSLNENSPVLISENAGLSQELQTWFSNQTSYLDDIPGIRAMMGKRQIRSAVIQYFDASFVPGF